MSNRMDDKGQPWRTLENTQNKKTIFPSALAYVALGLYKALTKAQITLGKPLAARTAKIHRWIIDGNAAAKSKRARIGSAAMLATDEVE